MEIILTQDVKNLGYKNDIVNVKPGYARNYLIPQGMAILATESARKVLAENMRQQAYKQEKIKKEAEELAKVLEGLSLRIPAKAASTGKSTAQSTTFRLLTPSKKPRASRSTASTSSLTTTLSRKLVTTKQKFVSTRTLQ